MNALDVRTFRTSWGHEIAYTDEGEGPVIVFGHGLLWSKRMFRPQIDVLKARYRCVAWDHPCQGESSDHPGSEVPIDVCADVAVELIEMLDVGPVHYVGLSMGGFVGMRLAARRPETIRSLVNLCTAADVEPIGNVGRYRRLNLVARLTGVGSLLAGQVMPVMFGETFLRDPARAEQRASWRRELSNNRRRIYRSVNGVIRRPAIVNELCHITAPTLHIAGEEDRAIVPSRQRTTADAIPGARFELVPRGGHTLTIERPDAVTSLLQDWFDAREADGG